MLRGQVEELRPAGAAVAVEPVLHVVRDQVERFVADFRSFSSTICAGV